MPAKTPQTREPLEHHTERYQVAMTVSAEKYFGTPEELVEMLNIIFIEHNPIGKWPQIAILRIDEAEKI